MAKVKYQIFTASEITQYAIKLLNVNGYLVWRSNNIPVRGRSFIGKKGTGDITGYQKSNGRRVECEVKKIGDTLKEDQIRFLTDFSKSGGLALIATQIESKIEIILFSKYMESIKIKIIK